jgi:hypothetical protein
MVRQHRFSMFIISNIHISQGPQVEMINSLQLILSPSRLLVACWVGVDSSCRNGVCTTCAGKVSQYISVETDTSPVFLTFFYELGDREYWKY